MKKESIFFDLAQKMNKKLSLIPTLQGSLGLQLLVDDELNPDDIDIGIPHVYYSLTKRWKDLLEFMQNEGYKLIDLHERTFQKGEVEVNFGLIDGGEPGEIPSLKVFSGIDAAESPIMETDGAIYKLLTLEQYLSVYTSSLNDLYRQRNKDNADLLKIKIIQRALDSRK